MVNTLLTLLFSTPYINLYVPKEFTTQDTVRAEITTEGVEKVLLRIYKIDNPYEFFKNQKDPFNIDTENTRRRKNFFLMFGSLIKDAGRYSRYVSREILSEDSRIYLRDALGIRTMKEEKPKEKKLPILPKLKYPLVKEWWYEAEDLYYNWENIEIGVLQKGVYILEASYGYKVCYVPLIVTDAGMIVKRSPKNILVYAQDIRRGIPLSGKVIVKSYEQKKVYEGKLVPQGVLISTQDSSDMFAFVSTKAGFALARVPYYVTYYRKYVIYLYTERPIYRPNQTVYFKGVARVKDRGYKVVKRRNVRVKIRNPQGTVIYDRSLKTNDFGSFADSCYIPENSPLGIYTLSAEIENSYWSANFRVEEYRKPEFKVEITTDKRRYLHNEKVKVKIKADYFFGEPVKNAWISINVYRAKKRKYWTYGTEVYESFEDNFDEEYEYQFVAEARDGDYVYWIEAGVRDKTGFEERARKKVDVYKARLKPYVAIPSWMFKKGEEIIINIWIKDVIKNKREKGRVTVTLMEEWRDEVVWKKRLYVPKKGKKFKFKVEEPGYYRIIVTTFDEYENEVQTKEWVWITGYEGFPGYARERIEILTDKKSYLPGETINIMVVAPEGVKSLLYTEEKGIIIKRKVCKVRNNVVQLSTKAQKSKIPNFYVSFVGYTSEGRLVRAEKSIKIDCSPAKLKIDISTNKEIYGPRDTVTYEIHVKDERGKPVEAELSIGVVDASIYAIAKKMVPSPLDFFYAEEESYVYTFGSFSSYFSGYEKRYALKMEEEKVVAAYKGEGEMLVRRIFKDVAYWAPFVKTDKRGYAQISFPYPDNLTTWIADVVGITKDTKAGENQKKTVVKKDVVLRFGVPRFLTQRDSVLIKAVVHNYLSQGKEFELKVRWGVKEENDTIIKFFLPAQEIKSFEIPVKIEKGDKFRIKGYVKTEKAYDALELSVPVLPHGIEKKEIIAGIMDESEKESFEFDLPELIHHKSLKITFTPSYLSVVQQGIKKLVGYPYGCVEQTMSYMLPDLVAKDVFKKDISNIPEIDKMIEKGIARLLGYQHSDGGWGWWKEDETNPFMTAYALYGLTYAKKLGFSVPQEVIDNGINSLLSQMRYASDPAEFSFMLYVALYAGVSPDTCLLYVTKIDSLKPDVYAMTYLAMAFEKLRDRKRALKYIKLLENNMRKSRGMRFLSGKSPLSWGERTVEITANALRAFLRVSPRSPLAEKLLLYLLSVRKEDGWSTTRETAVSILAITEYIKKKGDRKGDAYITVKLNGKPVKKIKVSKNSSGEELVIKELRQGKNRVTIERKGKGRIFYNAVVSYFTSEEGIQPRGEEIKVTRRYYALVPGEEGYTKRDYAEGVYQGMPILVETEVIPSRSFRYVVIEDPIPSGCEVAKEETFIVDGRRIRNPWWMAREIHDDRVAFFIYYLSYPRKFYYVLKPNIKGRFHVMPTKVYPMYYPEIQGNSAEIILDVR